MAAKDTINIPFPKLPSVENPMEGMIEALRNQ